MRCQVSEHLMIFGYVSTSDKNSGNSSEKTLDLFGGGILSLLPRGQRRSLKGGDTHGSLKGNGRFLS
jgi:hypothetical protein